VCAVGPAYAGRLNDDPLLPRNVALRATTMNSAYQLRLEKVVGSIEEGPRAGEATAAPCDGMGVALSGPRQRR
jgi:predicted amidohydrolase YtcJ